VRRKLWFVVAVALTVSRRRSSGGRDGGFTPQFAPFADAHRINTAYWVVLIFTSVVFVAVEGALVAFIWKYRRRGRPRTADGAQVYGHTRLELIWT